VVVIPKEGGARRPLVKVARLLLALPEP